MKSIRDIFVNILSFIFGKSSLQEGYDCVNCSYGTSTGYGYPCCECGGGKYFIDKNYDENYNPNCK